MQQREITRSLPEHERIVSIYEEAFPPEERFPFDEMEAMALKPQVEFTAYYADEAGSADAGLCGFTYSVDTPSYFYVLFLAVAAERRGQGVGSRILELARERHPGKTLVLEIEPLDPAAPNSAQRTARLAFYERNGFHRTGFDLHEDEMRYTVLALEPAGAPVFDPAVFADELRAIVHDAFPFELRPSM